MLATVIIVGLFVIGDGLAIFDSSCGFPGEGPKPKMTPELAAWYQQNFTDEHIRIISNKIVHQGYSYQRACATTGRYNFVGNEYAASTGNAAYNRLRHDVARVIKMKKEKTAVNR